MSFQGYLEEKTTETTVFVARGNEHPTAASAKKP
jgi:hypothetical protein